MLPNDETRSAFSPGSTGPLWIFLPFAAAYFLSYLFRTVNGSIASSLVTAFDLDARQLGLLTASYFFTFAVCQLPLGVALDRFGPRRVQTVLLSVAAAGAFLFALADRTSILILARALIGLGSSGALRPRH